MVSTQYILANNDAARENEFLEGWAGLLVFTEYPTWGTCSLALIPRFGVLTAMWVMLRDSYGGSYWAWSIAQCTCLPSFRFICTDGDSDTMMTLTRRITLRGAVTMTRRGSSFAVPAGTAPSVSALVSLKNVPTQQIHRLACFTVSLPDLFALLTCFAAVPSCRAPVPLSLCKSAALLACT